MRWAVVLVAVLALVPTLASADSFVITGPSGSVSNSSSSLQWTLTAAATGTWNINSWDIGLKCTGESGATGLTYNGSSPGALPSSNYLFTLAHDPLETTNKNNNEYYFSDSLTDPVNQTVGSIPAVQYNLLTINLNIAPGTTGKFDFTFDSTWDHVFSIVGGVPVDIASSATFTGFTVTVTPEPSSLWLLGCTAVACLFWWRRRR